MTPAHVVPRVIPAVHGARRSHRRSRVCHDACARSTAHAWYHGRGSLAGLAWWIRWTDDHALYRWHHRPRLLPQVNWSCGRTLRTWPQTRLLTATCMLHPMRAQSLPCLPFLKGQPVRVEERGRIGTPGHYRRIFVTCQEHCESGAAPCRIRRNTSSRQTATLGSNEPLAYLGAWLIAGRAIATREEHVAVKPTVFADTRIC